MIKKLRVTVEGKTYDVSVEILEEGAPRAPRVSASPADSGAATGTTPEAGAPAPSPARGGDGGVPSPLAGKVVSLDCKLGDRITEGQQIMTLEAMKMNTLVSAPSDGIVTAIHVGVGDTVEEGQPLLTIQ